MGSEQRDWRHDLRGLWRSARRKGWTRESLRLSIGWRCRDESRRRGLQELVLAESGWQAAALEEYEPEQIRLSSSRMRWCPLRRSPDWRSSYGGQREYRPNSEPHSTASAWVRPDGQLTAPASNPPLPALMEDTFAVQMTLSADSPNSMSFSDTYEGLENVWYKFSTEPDGSVTLLANSDGFEHLARYFLKMARSKKVSGYHAHHSLEFGDETDGGPELTIGIVDAPEHS